MISGPITPGDIRRPNGVFKQRQCAVQQLQHGVGCAITIKDAKFVAFGMTRRAGRSALPRKG